jgi:polysaccharide biosynthesis transport protein
MTAKQLLHILWARRVLIGAVFGGIVLVVLLISLIWPKTYVGEVSVVVDSKATDPVSGTEQSAEYLPSNIATQVDVIASHNVALKVVQALNLDADPKYQRKYQSDTGGDGSIKDWIADYLLKHLIVSPSRESRVLNVTISSRDPLGAARLANAFAQAYIQTSLEIKTEPAGRQTAWFNEQLLRLRRALEDAQRRLSDSQRSQSVVGTNDQMDIENARLGEISNQLIAAQASMYQAQTRSQQMNQALQRNQLQELPDILSNPVLQNMKSQLAQAEGRLADIGAQFGKNHPQYQSAAAEVKALQDKISAETNTAKGSISQSAQLSARQEAELRSALERQRDHILQLKRQHDDLDVLKRDVDDAQRTYDAGSLRASQVRLESELGAGNVAILNTAVPRYRPAYPNIPLNVLVSIVIGFLLGVAVALVAELSDRRIRSVVDVSDSAGLLVLAEIPRLAPRNIRNRAIAHIRGALMLQRQET